MLTNRLAWHLTSWKAWYALLAVPAFLASSVLVPAVAEELGPLVAPLQFIGFSVAALGLIALAARRWPTREDLALRRELTWRQIGVLLIVFVTSHVIFWLLAFGSDTKDQAIGYFEELGLDGSALGGFAALASSVILAPVCEELLFRGAVLRPVHDALARRGRAWWGAAAGIMASSVLFALPHLGGSLLSSQTLAYLVTGVAFGLVYVITGSMTAAMVSHALQSAMAFGQILIFGRGDTDVSPVLWILVLGCPLWVYLIARGLHAVFPKERAAG